MIMINNYVFVFSLKSESRHCFQPHRATAKPANHTLLARIAGEGSGLSKNRLLLRLGMSSMCPVQIKSVDITSPSTTTTTTTSYLNTPVSFSSFLLTAEWRKSPLHPPHLFARLTLFSYLLAWCCVTGRGAASCLLFC